MRRPAQTAFKPSEMLRRDPSRSSFSSKQFAANRAGFLLREYARQVIEQPPPVSITETHEADIGSADGQEIIEQGNSIERQQETLQALSEPVAEFSAQSVGALIAKAHQEGRSEALHEMQTAIDQAMVALSAAADALATRYAELERQLVIPVAKSGVELASRLARRALAEPEVLKTYLEQVVGSMSDSESHTMVSVRMNPADCALLAKSLPTDSHLKLIEDPQVSAGGVLVSGGDQVVDDRFERRLREVQEAALSIAADVLRELPT